MSLTLLTPAGSDPLTLSDLKAHLRVDHSDEDALIASYAKAATSIVEARTGLALLPQDWRYTLDAPPTDVIRLPKAPATQFLSINRLDADGAATLVPPNAYHFAPGAPGRLAPVSPWPSPGRKTGGIEINFRAGFADATSIPAALTQAVRLLAAHFYERREIVDDRRPSAIPETVAALIAPYRELAL